MIWLVMQGWFHEGQEVHSAWSTREEASMVADRLLRVEAGKEYPSVDYVEILEVEIGRRPTCEAPCVKKVFDADVPRKASDGGFVFEWRQTD